MAYEKKRLLLAAVGGTLAAALIISSIILTGLLPSAEAKGTLVVKVKDAPALLNELWLQIDGVQVHREGGGAETWKDVTVFMTEPFDLLSFRDVSTVLAFDELPVGNYTEIRFHIVSAWANITGNPHKTLQIAAPWVMIKIHFEIKEGTCTTLVIDIEVNEESIFHSGVLMPVAKATVEN